MKTETSLLERYIYLFVIFCDLLSRIIPLEMWLFIGRALGLTVYLVDAHHRKITLANLKFAYKAGKSEKEYRAMASRHFQEYGMIMMEFACLRRFIFKNDIPWETLVEVEGIEHLNAARKKHPSIILLSAHFGQFLLAHIYFGKNINPLNFIVRKIDHLLIERDRVRLNEKFGVRILYKENGLRQAIKRLRKGEDLIIFPDQKASLEEGVACRFFGEKTSTLAIVPSLARRYNIPVVPMFVVRSKGRKKHRIVFAPELLFNKESENMVKDVQSQNDVIQKMIELHPEHWLWSHRKWKCYHPEIYR